MKSKFIGALLMLFAVVCSANVLDVTDEFCTIEFIIPTNSDLNSKHKCFLKAFPLLALRISGQTAVLQNPAITKPEVNLDDFVNTYSYKAHPDGKLFSVTFDYHKVSKYLGNLGIEISTEKHHNLIMWLAVHVHDSAAKILGHESTLNVKLIAEDVAYQYGVSLVLPLHDLQDTLAVTAHDIIDLQAQKILQYSQEKYDAKSLILGNLYYKDNLWLLNVQFVGRKQAIWQIESANLTDLMATLYNNVAVLFLEQQMDVEQEDLINAVVSAANNDSREELFTTMDPKRLEISTDYDNMALNQPKTVLVVVSGIDDLGKYASIMSYLRRIDGIQSVDVAELGEDSAIFAIDTTQLIANLANSITQDKFLLPEGDKYITNNEMRFILNS